MSSKFNIILLYMQTACKDVIQTRIKDEIQKSSGNLTGVDIVKPGLINIEHLAPGGDAGRLTIITKSALKEIGGEK